ncbi:hypothetical protein [Rhodothermus marinus]|uniref:hypothetical protein n=1 Tax=Rhodothermus marinus TaxID=29549 RepID=UPI001DD51F29|nr:hypothetical protein [Rhodothermus marinus]MBO2490679.1 hypothetical protein [Rhodothermus marinus]
MRYASYPPSLNDLLFEETVRALLPDLGEVGLRMKIDELPKFLDPDFVERRMNQLHRYRAWAMAGMIFGFLAIVLLLVAAIFRLALPDYVLFPTSFLSLSAPYWGFRYARLGYFLYAYRMLNHFVYDLIVYKDYRPALHQLTDQT